MTKNKKFVVIIKEVKKPDNISILNCSLQVDFETIIYENCKNKNEVKKKLLEEYEHYFPNGKVFQQSKDNEYVYALIYELDDYWSSYWLEPIICPTCKKTTTRIKYKNNGGSLKYDCCSNKCLEIEETKQDKKYLNTSKYGVQFCFIYKITQISTDKCYIGKTVNHFIWRWWEHLKADTNSKFHNFLSDVDYTDLKFEVLQILPKDIEHNELLKIESDYIKKFNSIEDGFNSLISNKDDS